MYALRSILDKEPVAIASAVKAVVLVLVLFGIVAWTDEQVAGVLVALEVVLGLFVRSKSTPTSDIQALSRLRERPLRKKEA
jgi:hypothetical protein